MNTIMNTNDTIMRLLENPGAAKKIKHAAFTWAIKHNDVDAVRELIKDPDIDPSKYDNNAIITAIKHRFNEIVEVLIEDGRSVNVDTFRCAVARSNEAIISLFIARPNIGSGKNINSALIVAVDNNRPNIVTMLLSHPNVDPCYNKNIVLQRAVENKLNDIVSILLADGRVNPGANDNAILISSVSWGRHDMVRLLLKDKRVDPNARAHEALKIATRYNDAENVKMLLQRLSLVDGIRIYKQLNFGNSYLSHMIWCKYLIYRIWLMSLVLENFPADLHQFIWT